MARQKLDIQKDNAVAIYRPQRWMLRLWPIGLIAINVAGIGLVQVIIGADGMEALRVSNERLLNSDPGSFMAPMKTAFGLINLSAFLLLVLHSIRASFRDPALVLLSEGFVPRPVDHPHAVAEWSDVKKIKGGRIWPVSYLLVSFNNPAQLGGIGLRMPWPLSFLPMRLVVFTGLQLSKDARQVAEEMRRRKKEAM